MPFGNGKSSSGGTSSSGASKVTDSTYYSRLRIKNKDKLGVGFTFNKGLLKVEISEEKDSYRYEPLVTISLSSSKAKSLMKELEVFIKKMKDGEHIDSASAVGVVTGMGDNRSFIAFKVTGKQPEIPEHSMVIGKISADKVIQTAEEFVFATDYNSSMHWSNLESMEGKRQVDNFLDIEMFYDTLKEFVSTSSGALGAAVWDSGRYDMYNKIGKRFDDIYANLGIEIPKAPSSSSSSGYKSSGNFGNSMNRPTGGSSNKKSLDEIEDMF